MNRIKKIISILTIIIICIVFIILIQNPVGKAAIANRANNSFIIDIPITEYKGDKYVDIYLAYPVLKDTKLTTDIFTINNKEQYITLDAFKSLIKYTYPNVNINTNKKIKDIITVSNISRS